MNELMAADPSSDLRFDHIGVVVSSLAEGRLHLASVFGISRWTQEFADPINRVRVQFGSDASGICYETVSPLGPGSPVDEALRTGNRILNHVAYRTGNLDRAAARLQVAGCMPTGVPKPAVAYNGHRIQFFVTRLRFIIELVEAPDHAHRYSLTDCGDAGQSGNG